MVNRQEDMEREFSKTPGGNYFNYVDSPKLEQMGITQYRPARGPNAIRIVYPPDRPGFYGLEIFKHSNVGADRKTFLCRKRMFKEDCPICNAADVFKREDPQDERAAALYAGRRYLFFVVDVFSNDTMAKGVRWFDCPVGIYNEIKTRSKNKRRRGDDEGKDFRKYIDVSHPVNGRDIEFEQVKTKSKTDYEGVSLIESEPVPEDWYQDLPEFSDILKISTTEEMLEALAYESEPEETEVVEDSPRETKERVEEDPPAEPKEQEKKEDHAVTPRGTSPRGAAKEKEDSDVRDRIRERLERTKRANQTEVEEG